MTSKFANELQQRLEKNNWDIQYLSYVSGLTMLELELLMNKEVKMLDCRAERLARVLGGNTGYWLTLYKEE